MCLLDNIRTYDVVIKSVLLDGIIVKRVICLPVVVIRNDLCVAVTEDEFLVCLVLSTKVINPLNNPFRHQDLRPFPAVDATTCCKIHKPICPL